MGKTLNPDKYVPEEVVDAMVRQMRMLQISQSYMANALGVSRPYLTKLLSKRRPMAQVYGLAMKMVMIDWRMSK